MQRLGRILGNVLAVVLTVFSLQAMAADASLAGRDFNHMTTGFPLTGGHATAACESCHVAGVFKGTAKNCDGCHALGKRVVATPKSTSHIVTDAPCETCHFNNFTFYGAKYNHGTAIPGQCTTCHNGRITTGRPASHNANLLMATGSCDGCHRSYAFIPASWDHAKNHVVIGDGSCVNSGCHNSGSGNRYTSALATSPVSHSYTDTSTKVCDTCHLSYLVWTSTQHEPQTTTCAGCHNGTTAQTHITASHPSTTGTTDCSTCHASTTTWAGALGGTPYGHTYTGTCTNCHPTPSTVLTGAALHTNFGGATCTSCHLTKGLTYTLNNPIQTKNHNQPTDCSASGCHKPLGNKGTSYQSWN